METQNIVCLSEEVLEKIANNSHFEDKVLLTELTELFVGHEDASEYLYLYGEYCEVMDDLVDEPGRSEDVDRAGLLKIKLGQSKYWLKYCHILSFIERFIHHTYFDMVQWERAEEEWKRRDARALNHCSYWMLFAVILIEFGDEVLRKYSLRFREHAHKRHLQDIF